MKFVVKEFLSAASWVTPRALIRLDRFLSDSFPFEFSSSFPGNGLERIAGGPGYRKLRRNALIRFNSRYFWPFVASNDGGVRRAFTAGKEIQRATRTMRGEPDHLRVAR